jgi:hypothetical protein
MKKNKTYYTIGTVPTKSNRNNIDKMDTPNTDIHDCLHSWLYACS